jgi:DNA-binding LacI/PurR family transcriptional regulator
VETRDRQAVRDFLLGAAEHAGTDLTGLARRAGVAPSTVTRFINGESRFLPTTRTLSKIADASGYGTPAFGRQNRKQLMQAFQNFAAEVGVNLAEVAILAGADRKRLRRTAELLAMINSLDPDMENRVFELLRGMTEAAGTPEKNGSPSEAGSGRVSA